MTGRARLQATGLHAGAVTTTRSTRVVEGWKLLRSQPDTFTHPSDIGDDCSWTPLGHPGTVASVIGTEALDAHPDYDRHDWWFQTTFPEPSHEDGHAVRLRFDGLATLADVWLNGEPLISSTNMFVAHEVDVTDLLRAQNDLHIAFRSLSEALSERRPRPRWKTALVSEPNLRWFRTTLLGRIPGWTPAIHPVGPWRPVWLQVLETVDVQELTVRPRLEADLGTVQVEGTVRCIGPGVTVDAMTLRVGDSEATLSLHETGSGTHSFTGSVTVEEPELWWPRTHGEPNLYECSLTIATSAGETTVDCGSLGFRSVEIDRTDGRVQFVVNGVPIFCRGACWTTNDIVSLAGDPEEMRKTLCLATESHANMIRVGGTMVYESDAFYDACDRLGLMVWQDFMFANMDYPVDDADFADAVESETRQQARRLSSHPSVVAYCGGSEVEQQAAMFGAPREIWSNEFFSDILPGIVEEHAPGIPYWPSTPTGGALPFHVGDGITHYYGVGAYRRPPEDVRTASVRFTPECLGFSNVPEPANLATLTAEGSVAPHHPAWKAGVPRDSGAGWDFEDIRDHYLESLHQVDAVRLRSEDLTGYLRLSRVVTGRLMERTFTEWRCSANRCSGGLVWFLKDLRPGAGWGVIDSDNHPKAAYYFLKRAWAPRRVAIVDRGLDGVEVHVHNEWEEPLEGTLEIEMLGGNGRVTARGESAVQVAPRGQVHINAEALLGHFADPTYSYRFGPPRHAAVRATLSTGDAGANLVDMYWPSPAVELPDVALEASVDMTGGTVVANGLAQAIRLEIREATPSDNYFDLPGGAPTAFAVDWDGGEPPERIRGFVGALNAPLDDRISDGR